MTIVASDIMTRDVVCIPADMDLREVAKVFVERQISGAPVVDGEGRAMGVISLTNLAQYAVTRADELNVEPWFYSSIETQGRHPQGRGFQIEDVNSGEAREFMTPVVHSVAESAPLATIARLMTSQRIHRVIVISGSRVVGIISALDMIAAYHDAAADTSHATPRRDRRRVTP